MQNLPDIGKTPLAASQGPQGQALFNGLSTLFNSTLNAAIGSAGLNVIQFNAFALATEIAANPALFGFVNATTPACTTASSLACTPSTLVAPNANMNYVFADGVHPTTGAAIVLSQAITSMITGPQQMAALGQAPADVERANWRTLDGRMMSAINAPGSAGKLQAWAAYDYADADIFGASLSGNGDLNTISVGMDMRVSDKMLAGVQFAYTEYKGNFGNGGGDFKLRRADVHGLHGLRRGPVVRRRDARRRLARLQHDPQHRAGRHDAHRVRRDARLSRRRAAAGRLLVQVPNVDHGPFVKLTYDKSVVREFSENGNDSTALTYDQQKNDAFWSSLGWQATGNWSGFRPFARATWEYNFNADTTQVTAKPISLNGWYTVPGFEQDDNWWLFDLGVSKEFGGVTGFLSGNVSAGKGDGDYWAVTVGIRVPL